MRRRGNTMTPARLTEEAQRRFAVPFGRRQEVARTEDQPFATTSASFATGFTITG
jgi:hypothetical protein